MFKRSGRIGFCWDNSHNNRVKKDITDCPNCNGKMEVMSEDKEWILEQCNKCVLKRKRRPTK